MPAPEAAPTRQVADTGSCASLTPANCSFIEGSRSGIRAAQSAGMAVLGRVGGLHAALSGLETAVTGLEPDACFDDIRVLPGLVDSFDMRIEVR